MTYLELYCKAIRQLENDEITFDEYKEMTKVLDREVEERKTGKILIYDKYRLPMYECLGCNHSVMKYWKYCPHCGNNIEERKNE